MKRMIGILGEALIDFIGTKDSSHSACFYPYPGGCALNASIASARLGSDVLYIGKLSSDMFGALLRNHLASNSIQIPDSFRSCPQQTMIGFAQLDDHGSASYAFYIEGTTVVSLTTEEILQILDEHPVEYLHIGSVALTLEQSGSAIITALQQMKHVPFLFLDPNVRLTMIQDRTSYQKRLMKAVSLSSIVKLSDEDLSLLFPDMPVLRAVSTLLDAGAAHVVLTKGSRGIEWHASTGFTISQPALSVRVVDTVGAGDTVSGALLNYCDFNSITDPLRLDKAVAEEALMFAAKAASFTCMKKGCDPPYRSDVVTYPN